MKILYCCWNEIVADDVINNLNIVAGEVVCFKKTVREYLDGRVISQLSELMDESVNYVFSHDFFPLVSQMCKTRNIPYISVVYDWPNYTLFNPAVYNECNRIYLLDSAGVALMRNYRVDNISYMPLCVDVDRLDKKLGTLNDINYKYDVSFVGNMYLGKNEALLSDNIPPYYSGFVDALVNAQRQIYGYNLVNEVVDKKFAAKYLNDVGTSLGGMNVPAEFVLATRINELVTGVDRRELLKCVAEEFSVDLFTQSKADNLGNVKIHGGVDYISEMPWVFRESKINLNITLRSITNGVPLRVFDILGAGGFCLTNYQADICEHFADGRDLVMFGSAEDMIEKIRYYLEHEDERTQIARNGHEAVKKYSYRNTYEKIFK